jgi:hypothetical protein
MMSTLITKILIFKGSGPDLPYLGISGSKYIPEYMLAKNKPLIEIEGSLEAYH